MTFISLPIGTLTLDITSLVNAHSGLIQQIAGDSLSHALHSFIRRSGSRRGLSRRMMRKNMNRKRRWFVDNIIMHHKRLHDRNRAIVVSNARTRALAKRDAAKQPQSPSLQRSAMVRERTQNKPSMSAMTLKERGAQLRGRVDARRIRARSRWLSTMAA